MISALKILAVAALWYVKSSSLPKFSWQIRENTMVNRWRK